MTFNKKYSLNDIVVGLTDLLGAHWKNALVFSAAVFFIPGVLYFLAFQGFFDGLSNIMQQVQYGDLNSAQAFSGMMNALALPYVWLLLVSILIGLVANMVALYCLISAREHMAGRLAVPKTAIVESLRTLPRLFGQGFIMFCIMFVLVVLLYAGFFGVVFVATAYATLQLPAALMVGIIVGSLVIGLLALILIIWFSVKLGMAQVALVFEPSFGIFEALGRSFRITKGSFWRVLGLSLLVSIVFSFALGILTGPLIFLFILPAYIDMLSSIMNGGGADLMSMLPDVYGKMVWGIAISSYIQYTILGVVWPFFMSLLYRDLQVRSGLVVPDPDDSAPRVALDQSNNGGAVDGS